MKQTTKRTLIVCVVVLVAVPAILYAVSPTARGELSSAYACYTLGKSGFRPLAAERQNRFLGKVKDFTMKCRGGDLALVAKQTPWVDWSRYWGAADPSSHLSIGTLPAHR